MAAINNIGIMTSGGDSPGMNAAIRAIVRTSISHNLVPFGIMRGYQGMIDGDIKELQTTDGFKYFFDDDRWVMIRPSGTEPVLRTYAETSSRELAFEMLEACKKTLLG